MVFPSFWASCPFMGGWGEVVDTIEFICVPRCGCDTVSIGCTGVNTICRFGGRVGGSRYETGIPKVKLRRLTVAMISLLTIPEGGKRKGIVCMGNEPQ